MVSVPTLYEKYLKQENNSQNKIISRITRDEYIGFLSRMDRGEADAFARYAGKIGFSQTRTSADVGGTATAGFVRETELSNTGASSEKDVFLPWVGMLSGVKSDYSSKLDSVSYGNICMYVKNTTSSNRKNDSRSLSAFSFGSSSGPSLRFSTSKEVPLLRRLARWF